MRRIAVINQKGGVGKTTTTVNLGAALARQGHPTVVCDLDPQCNLTVHMDVDPSTVDPSLYDVFHGRASLANVIARVEAPAPRDDAPVQAPPPGAASLWVAPASNDLAGVELELVNAVGREVILADAVAAPEWREATGAEYLLIDCPPSLGLLSLNALVACDELLVPIQAEFFALQGLGKLLEVVDLVQRRLNPGLRIAAMVSCRHDPSTKLGKAVIADIKAHFGEVFLDTVIRRNVKLAEAPSHGRTIFDYDPDSRGAEDYLALARELHGHNDEAPPSAVVVTPEPTVKEPEVEETKAPEPKAAEADPAPAGDPPAGDSDTSASKSATTKSASRKPAKRKTAARKPAAKKPAAKKPAAKKPAADKPAAVNPAVTKPAAAKPAVTRPAVTKPAGTTPAATEPAAPEPVQGEDG